MRLYVALVLVVACRQPEPVGPMEPAGQRSAPADAAPADAPDTAVAVPEAGLAPAPIRARIVRADVSGADMLLTLDRGSSDLVTKDAKVRWVKPVPGELTLVRVDKHTSVVRARIPYDLVIDHLDIEILPP